MKHRFDRQHHTNTSSTAINGWSVNWQYTTNQITSSWNANLSGSASSATATSNSTTSTANSSKSNSIISSSISSAVNNAINLVLTATASTSYVSPWETLAAVNDNSQPENSNDKSKGMYGNWNNPNSYQWVEYLWSNAVTISST